METGELKFELIGDKTEAAADRLEAVLGDGAKVGKRSVAHTQPDHDTKIIDPISLMALIISIPSAILAVMDLADRVTKRRKATEIIDAAKQVKVEMNVQIMLVGHDNVRRELAQLGPDDLLEAASSTNKHRA